MAKIDIVMPQMGESITTGTITKWNKAPGDTIELDEILLEISTDKVESEIPSPVKGKVAELLFAEGDTVDVGVKIAVIEDDLSAKIESSAPSAKKETPKSSPPPNANGSSHLNNQIETSHELSGSPSVATERGRFYTPLVKKLASEAGVGLNELAQISGSGAGGRVNRDDFEHFVQNRSSSNGRSTTTPLPAPVKVDVLAGYHGETEIIPMDNMRKAIAKNMIASKLTSPHVNSISEVDLSHLVHYRESVKDDFLKNEGFKLTYSPFIIYAIIHALKAYPLVNASVDGDNLVVKKDINVGCAVAVPGNGLVVPVIKNADNLNMLGICRAVNTLALKARSKKLTMDDLQGGTFTFTNVGSFGTLMATPVILQPQVGIYASGVIQKRVVVTAEEAIAIRSMMWGTHTYDHRVVDGELGGKFLEEVHRQLVIMKPSQLF